MHSASFPALRAPLRPLTGTASTADVVATALAPKHRQRHLAIDLLRTRVTGAAREDAALDAIADALRRAPAGAVRGAAADALADVGISNAVTRAALRDALAHEVEEFVLVRVLTAVGRLARHDGAMAAAVLDAARRNSSSVVRAAAITVLRATPGRWPAPVVRVLLQAFARDPAPAVRAEAALSLATIPTPVLLDALRDVDAFVAHLRREMCDGDDVIARRAAIHLAGTFATVAPALAETLLDMVDVPHSPPKRGGQGPTRARWHCDRQCVPAALEALRSFPDAVYAAWPVVLDRLSDVSPEVSGAARSLLTALVDRAPDPLPRDAARAVCRRYPDLQGAGGVARQLAAHAVLYREPSFAAWMTVAALRFRDVSLVALPHLPTDHVRDLLLDASDKSVTWFAELLERVADTERPGVVTRDGILRWASHEDQRVRLAVIRLLTSLGDAEEDAPVLESEPTIAEDAGPLRLDRD